MTAVTCRMTAPPSRLVSSSNVAWLLRSGQLKMELKNELLMQMTRSSAATIAASPTR